MIWRLSCNPHRTSVMEVHRRTIASKQYETIAKEDPSPELNWVVRGRAILEGGSGNQVVGWLMSKSPAEKRWTRLFLLRGLLLGRLLLWSLFDSLHRRSKGWGSRHDVMRPMRRMGIEGLEGHEALRVEGRLARQTTQHKHRGRYY